MPPLRSISRNDFIRILRLAGFDGPFSGGKHQFMRRGSFKLTIPNPHQGLIDINLLNRLLKQANISREEWSILLTND
ncbi:type II toxin-antitoxin system HicA family toxin [Spirosoma arcticum]